MLLAGIDEAGYGPMLGPLCVGLAAFRVPDPEPDSPPQDLWKLLERGVCRDAGRGGARGTRGRVPIADSKALKLSNSVTTTHPLIHLERGVLVFLHAAGTKVTCDASLQQALACGGEPSHECYAGEAISLPHAVPAGELAISTNLVRGALAGSGVDVVSMECRRIDEARFNRVVRDTGSKAEATGEAVAEHLRRVVSLAAHEPPGSRIGVVCDRQGGRAQYAGFLERAVPGASVEVVGEDDRRSRYVVVAPGDGGDVRLGVSFITEAESAYLPVALASMTAKLVRELSMARFNRYWCARAKERLGVELKPTAGYATDARRWLEDARDTLTDGDRQHLVRIA